jgi:hypothetical protein
VRGIMGSRLTSSSNARSPRGRPHPLSPPDAGPSFHMGLTDERSSNPLKQVGAHGCACLLPRRCRQSAQGAC